MSIVDRAALKAAKAAVSGDRLRSAWRRHSSPVRKPAQHRVRPPFECTRPARRLQIRRPQSPPEARQGLPSFRRQLSYYKRDLW